MRNTPVGRVSTSARSTSELEKTVLFAFRVAVQSALSGIANATHVGDRNAEWEKIFGRCSSAYLVLIFREAALRVEGVVPGDAGRLAALELLRSADAVVVNTNRAEGKRR